MTPEEAVSLGILAINIFLYPDATVSDEDVTRLDHHGDEAVEALVRLREFQAATS